MIAFAFPDYGLSKETAPARREGLGPSQLERHTNGRATFIIVDHIGSMGSWSIVTTFRDFPRRSAGLIRACKGRGPCSEPGITHYFTQVLSAFKAVSADAIVECAAPTTFMLPPAAGCASTI